MEEIKQGYKQTDIGMIPDDWTLKSLSFLSEKNMVGIASSATYAYRLTGVKMFRNQNIKPNLLDDKDIIYLDPNYEVLFRNKRLQEGDLLTARTGYPGTTCIVPKKHEGSQSFTTLISRIKHDLINVDYLCYYINSEFGQSFFDQNKIGGGQQNINAATLKIMPIPYPKNKEEQIAIATALSDTDALIAALDKKIAKKQQIKQGAMQQLLTGKKRLPGFRGEWVEKQLGEITLSINSGKYKSENSTGQYPVYGSTGIIQTSNKYDFEGIRILVARVGANAGKVNLVCGKFSVTDNALIIDLKEDINFVLINYILCFKELNKIVFGSGQPLITGGQLKKLELSLPNSIKEQAAIAQILTDMDNEITQLEKERDKYKELKAGMMQVLLTGRVRLV